MTARPWLAGPTVDPALVRELKNAEDQRFLDVDAYLSAWDSLLVRLTR